MTRTDPEMSNTTARYLVPILADGGEPIHLRAACQLAARDGGQIVALRG